MRKRATTIGDVFEQARAPYTHMSEQDAELFYSTMNALLVYTNERLGIVDPNLVHERPENPNMLYTYGGRIAEGLWRNRSLVDDFVSENPTGLSEEALACARPWRHALRDMFTCVDADEDRIIVMNDDRLFVVGAMQDPADSHVHHIPSLDLLVLLPFKGGIVTDGKTLHLAPRPRRDALPHIIEQLRALCARPLVESAEELLDYAKDVPDTENRVSPRFQSMVDQGFLQGLLA